MLGVARRNVVHRTVSICRYANDYFDYSLERFCNINPLMGVWSMRKHWMVMLSLSICLLAFSNPAWCQSATAPLQLAQAQQRSAAPVAQAAPAVPDSDMDIRSRINNWTVTVMGGPRSSITLKMAVDLGDALDDGDNLRIMPVVSRGAKQNVLDLLYLKGADIALTYSDVLEELKKDASVRNIERRVQYISQAHVSGVYVLARPEIKSLKDLAGKTVNYHIAGSGASNTAPIVFQRLGIKALPIYVPNQLALEKMKSGEVAALVQLVAKGSGEFLTQIPSDSGFHLLNIEYDSKFEDYYTPYTIEAAEYPNLIKPGESVETLGLPALIAVYNWPVATDRYRRVERFIQYYFTHFEKLKQQFYQPEWKNVSLGAKVPGWTRYAPAEEALAKLARNELSTKTMVPGGSVPVDPSDPHQQQLFNEFLAWKQSQGRR